ncbi:hypothetical protein AB0I77_53260, partial [Streptomyces sp. NPDC050619]
IPHDRLARVYAYDALGSFVALPAGEMAAGPLAARLGIHTTLLGGAALMTAATAAALCSPQIRTLTTGRTVTESLSDSQQSGHFGPGGPSRHQSVRASA